jgi:hypothetical protein
LSYAKYFKDDRKFVCVILLDERKKKQKNTSKHPRLPRPKTTPTQDENYRRRARNAYKSNTDKENAASGSLEKELFSYASV